MFLIEDCCRIVVDLSSPEPEEKDRCECEAEGVTTALSIAASFNACLERLLCLKGKGICIMFTKHNERSQ